ncbi:MULTISPECIES: putative type IX sorting system protein PorV2 [Chitinophagaceae]
MNYLKPLAILAMGYFAFQNNLQAQFRTYSNEFLNIGAGARALGMGGAQVASATDVTAGYWNPAGLAHVNETPEFAAQHAEYFSGIGKYDYLAGAFPVANGDRTLGVSMLRFGVDDIPNTLFLVNPDGSLNYNNITTFSSADYAFLFSYAQFLRNDDDLQISFGGNAKIIYRKVGTFANAWGAGLDAALMFKGYGWSAGIVAKDITTTYNAWKFHFTDAEKQMLYLTNNDIPIKSTESTAPSLQIGGAYNFEFSEKFTLSTEASLNFTFDGKRNTLISSKPISIDPHLGIEANISDRVFIRGGISNFQRALKDGDTLNIKKTWIYQPSVGAGFKLGNATIDYAFVNLANQSNPLYTHVFSLKIFLGQREH